MTSPDLSRAEFRASFPPIMSAMLFGADGVRIKLDIPETDKAEALKMTQWQGKVLRVVITVDDSGQDESRRIKI